MTGEWGSTRLLAWQEKRVYNSFGMRGEEGLQPFWHDRKMKVYNACRQTGHCLKNMRIKVVWFYNPSDNRRCWKNRWIRIFNSVIMKRGKGLHHCHKKIVCNTLTEQMVHVDVMGKWPNSLPFEKDLYYCHGKRTLLAVMGKLPISLPFDKSL